MIWEHVTKRWTYWCERCWLSGGLRLWVYRERTEVPRNRRALVESYEVKLDRAGDAEGWPEQWPESAWVSFCAASKGWIKQWGNA